jgi:hypothetical protein
MKLWHFFVIVLSVSGCYRPPATDDSYFITMEDYSRVSVDTVHSPAETPDTLQITMPDTTLFVPLDGDSLITPDSLFQADTLEIHEPDTVPVFAEMVSWRSAALEVRGSLYQTMALLDGINPDILGAHCVTISCMGDEPLDGLHSRGFSLSAVRPQCKQP